MKKFDKKDILTIPNLLSFFRLLLIPFIVWLYIFRQQYFVAFILVVISGITDVIDGKIARKFNMVSDFGKILDPVADKLTQASLIICLLSRYRLLWIVVCLFITKELLMIVWGIMFIKNTDMVSSSKWFGKASTVTFFFVTIILMMITEIPAVLADVLIGIASAMMMLSLVMYGMYYYKVIKGSGHQGVTGKFAAYTILISVGSIAVTFAAYHICSSIFFITP